MIILRSTGPVISTRRSSRSFGIGATVQLPCRTPAVSGKKSGSLPASSSACLATRRSSSPSRRGLEPLRELREKLERFRSQNFAVRGADRTGNLEVATNQRRGHLVSTAESRIAAHAARAHGRRARLGGRAVGVRRERGEFLGEMRFSARGTIQLRGLGRAPQQLLKLGPAVLAFVFVDGHKGLLLFSQFWRSATTGPSPFQVRRDLLDQSGLILQHLPDADDLLIRLFPVLLVDGFAHAWNRLHAVAGV